jgi:conjugal transfer pilus assembly protein TraE
MNTNIFNSKIKQLVKSRNTLGVVAALIMFSNIILGAALLLKDERVVIIPAQTKQGFWTTNSVVSKEYLEEMSVFFTSLILDVSPSSAPFKRDMVLRHVTPETYGVLKRNLIAEENRYVKENLSTSFKPIKANIDAERLEVDLEGILAGYIAGKRVTQKKETIRIRFNYKQGILSLKSFKMLGVK